MSLSDGDPAADGDIWFRIATVSDHLKHGRVHHSAFGGNAVAPPKGTPRPWTRELSGRLRSMAGSIDAIKEHAERYCEALKSNNSKATFAGVVYVRVRDGKKKSHEGILETGIYYTPKADDQAHADFTFNGWIEDSQEARQKFNLWFVDILRALHNPQLDLLPEAEAPSSSNGT